MNIVKRFFQLERYNVSFEKPIPNEGPRAAAKRRTVRLVLCALLCALNFVIMLFGELSGVMDLTALVGRIVRSCDFVSSREACRVRVLLLRRDIPRRQAFCRADEAPAVPRRQVRFL